MTELTKNFAVSTVATAPSPAASGTSLAVTSGHGSRFPAPPFNAIVAPSGVQSTVDNAEIIRVTAVSGDSFTTIVRAQESSSARSIAVGDRVHCGITAKTFIDIDAGLAGYQLLQALPPVQFAAGATAVTRNAVSVIASLVTSGLANSFGVHLPLYAADLDVAGRTTKLKTRLSVGCNGTAPASHSRPGCRLSHRSGEGRTPSTKHGALRSPGRPCRWRRRLRIATRRPSPPHRSRSQPTASTCSCSRHPARCPRRTREP